MQEGKAKELEIAPMNFSLSLEERMIGMMGLPSYLIRAKEMERAEELFWEKIEERYKEHVELYPNKILLKKQWHEYVENYDIESISKQMESYNKCFPIEANLPMDPETKEYLHYGEPFKPYIPPTVNDILKRFPC